MKTSHKRSVLAALMVAVSGFAIVTGGVSTAPARADTTTYTPWSGATGQQLKALITDLKAKIAAAESSQAASPDFLADLKALVTKYEALQTSGAATAGTATGPAVGTQVFMDDFSDNDYTSNPTWKVSAGTWTVDTGGKRSGLVSKVRPQKLNINNVLGALLNNQQETQSANSQFASIYTPAKIPNAFAMTVKLQSKDAQGALNLGVYQGAAGSTLYRMVYQPGAAPGLSIQKVTPQGATTLGSYSGTVNLEDGAIHTLVLTRNSQGAMKIALDGKSMASATDTSLTGDMTGLLFINSGGAYWIRSVSVVAN